MCDFNDKGVVYCDKCGNKLIPKIEKKKDEDLEITSFRCDNCGKEYIVCVTDERVREDQKKLLSIRNKIKSIRSERKKEVDIMASKYNEMIKHSTREKQKKMLIKNFKKWIFNTGKPIDKELERLYVDCEVLKKSIFDMAKVLKENYMRNRKVDDDNES